MAHEIYYEGKCNTGFPGGSAVKECLPMQETQHTGLTPGSGRFPGGGNGTPLPYSCLENPIGQRSLVGYSPWAHKESDMTEQLTHIKEWPASVGGPRPFRKEQKAPLQPLKSSMWRVVQLRDQGQQLGNSITQLENPPTTQGSGVASIWHLGTWAGSLKDHIFNCWGFWTQLIWFFT